MDDQLEASNENAEVISVEEAEGLSVDDQLEASNEDADGVTDELVEGPMNQDESLMQVGEGSEFPGKIKSRGWPMKVVEE